MLIFNLTALLAIAALFPSVSAVCNVCQVNGVSCVNSTSFYLCYGNQVPNYEFLYRCNDGFDCTDATAICVQNIAGRPASCGDTSLCGLCSAHRSYLFACTSRSTFRLCYGSAQPKSELGYCPSGYVCDASSNNVCVPPAEASDVTCDIPDPVDDNQETTTAVDASSSSTISTPLTAQEVCDLVRKVGVYQIPGDVNCLQYVRCYMQSGVIYGSLMACPSTTYFSGDTLQCVLKRPSYCV